MVCRDFILPEPASYVFFYTVSNLRKLLYIIYDNGGFPVKGGTKPLGEVKPGASRMEEYKNKWKSLHQTFNIGSFIVGDLIRLLQLRIIKVVDSYLPAPSHSNECSCFAVF